MCADLNAVWLEVALSAAKERGAQVSTHPGTGATLIDGMRWDYWMRLKDRETTTFRGRVCVKEK